MRKGISVRLTGANVEATTKALATRLLELGSPVEVLDDSHAACLGGPGGAAYACRLLSRNGVIVLATYAGAPPEGDCVEAEIDAHDTPEFAAEKAIDALAEEGLVSLDTTDYSPEEEEEIRKRLADLGYIE
jgi:hypothetical protein